MKMMKHLNLKLIIYVLILLIISNFTLANINSLLSVQVSEINFAFKQIIGILIAVIGMLIIYFVDLNMSKNLINIVYFILLGMLFILPTHIPIIEDLFVKTANGANGWFQFFTPRLSFQPVEFFKVVSILKLAMISADHLEGTTNDYCLLKQYAIYGLFPVFLILIEPDLGGAILILFTTIVMGLFSIKDKKLVKKIVFALVGGICLLSIFLFFEQGQAFLIKYTPVKAYQLGRLDAWLKPFTTSLGYQLQQALIFMGSAGPFGYGAGYDLINIIEPQTDLIFASAVGFWGWSIGVVIITTYFLIIWEILKIGEQQKKIYYQYICIGFAALFFIQVFENIGMIIGLLPITGIVLPYMSYGVSAIITYFAILGIILNISRNQG